MSNIEIVIPDIEKLNDDYLFITPDQTKCYLVMAGALVCVTGSFAFKTQEEIVDMIITAAKNGFK